MFDDEMMHFINRVPHLIYLPICSMLCLTRGLLLISLLYFIFEFSLRISFGSLFQNCAVLYAGDFCEISFLTLGVIITGAALDLVALVIGAIFDSIFV